MEENDKIAWKNLEAHFNKKPYQVNLINNKGDVPQQQSFEFKDKTEMLKALKSMGIQFQFEAKIKHPVGCTYGGNYSLGENDLKQLASSITRKEWEKA